MLSSIMDWVEKNRAPESIIASQLAGEKIIRTRPLFPYPSVARYSGRGDINEAANWERADPPVEYDGDIKWAWDPD
jgi:feruloyl esterase